MLHTAFQRVTLTASIVHRALWNISFNNIHVTPCLVEHTHARTLTSSLTSVSRCLCSLCQCSETPETCPCICVPPGSRCPRPPAPRPPPGAAWCPEPSVCRPAGSSCNANTDKKPTWIVIKGVNQSSDSFWTWVGHVPAAVEQEQINHYLSIHPSCVASNVGHMFLGCSPNLRTFTAKSWSALISLEGTLAAFVSHLVYQYLSERKIWKRIKMRWRCSKPPKRSNISVK